jgi:hypothetical protein
MSEKCHIDRDEIQPEKLPKISPRLIKKPGDHSDEHSMLKNN